VDKIDSPSTAAHTMLEAVQLANLPAAIDVFEYCYIVQEVVENDCYGFRQIESYDTTVFDIGANVGLFAAYASRTVRKVYCYEPCRANFKNLYKYLGRGRYHCNYYCQPIGLGPDAMLSLSESAKGTNVSALTSIADKAYQFYGATLQHLCRYQVPEKSFIKIDCEGGEEHLLWEPALKDTKEILRRCIGFGIELHNNLIGDAKVEAIVAMLQNLRDCNIVKHHNGLIITSGPKDRRIA